MASKVLAIFKNPPLPAMGCWAYSSYSPDTLYYLLFLFYFTYFVIFLSFMQVLFDFYPMYTLHLTFYILSFLLPWPDNKPPFPGTLQTLFDYFTFEVKDKESLLLDQGSFYLEHPPVTGCRTCFKLPIPCDH